MQFPSYEEFKSICRGSKGVISCHVDSVRDLASINNATCNMTVLDNTTRVTVYSLVVDVYFNGMGIISNPSAIKNWAGWNKNL